jgi:hypothetical protein
VKQFQLRMLWSGESDEIREFPCSKADCYSLLPAPMHTAVAKHCIQHRKHLVTASYISPEMKALDQAYVWLM